MFTSILSAAILTLILVISVDHMPAWFKRILLKVPVWAQCLLLHFAYSSWIGGVSGHLLGAPMAILWFVSWQYFVKPRLEAELANGKSLTLQDTLQAAKVKYEGLKSDLNAFVSGKPSDASTGGA